MIERLDWDSSFFGFEVGRLELPQRTELSLLIANCPFRLIYIFSDEPVEFDGFALVDIKVEFAKCVRQVPFPDEVARFDSNKHSYRTLLELALLSGKYSRFAKDSNFHRNEFAKLYKRWIDRSIESENIEVLIFEVNGITLGFVTLEIHSDAARIGLIATSVNHQGRGVAQQLIAACENICVHLNISTLFVATQFANKPAMRLYIKTGFTVKRQQHIYHHWNYDTI